MSEKQQDLLLEQVRQMGEEVPEMPEDFHDKWVRAVKEEADREKTPTSWKHTAVTWLCAAAAMVFVLGGAVYGRQAMETPASGQTMNTRSLTEEYDTAGIVTEDARNMVMFTDTLSAEPQAAGGVMMKSAAQEKKIIRTAYLTVATRDFGASLSGIRQKCEALGGMMTSTSEYEENGGLRRAYLTMKIPSDRLDEFLQSTGNLGRITQKGENAYDATVEYYDTLARLETQQALMTRLQSLVTEAASLSELLELESQIADTQYTIDRLQESLLNTDRQVDYATVDVTLKEEKASEAAEDGQVPLWERLALALESGWETFTEFLEEAALFLVAALPFAGIAAAAWLTVRLIIRRMCKKKK